MPYLALIAATAVGATGGLFIKSSPFTSLALGGFRTLVPLILLLPIMIRRKGLTGPAGSRRVLWGASVINAGRLLLYILAFKLSSMGNAVVIFLYLAGVHNDHSCSATEEVPGFPGNCRDPDSLCRRGDHEYPP
jgi:hypothetical protein